MSQNVAISRYTDSLAAVETILEDYWKPKIIPLESLEQKPKTKENLHDTIAAQKSLTYTITLNVTILVSSIGGLLLLITISPLLIPFNIIIIMAFALVQALVIIKSETECIMKKIKKRMSRTK
ncbi:MAG: hypothetical protein ACFFBY_02330 [Promethearchaeota archaeon]